MNTNKIFETPVEELASITAEAESGKFQKSIPKSQLPPLTHREDFDPNYGDDLTYYTKEDFKKV